MPDPLADRLRMIRLFDVYGGLLTARRQRLLRMYYHDDLSLGEIAARLRVTRQAVYDSLRRSVEELERLETSLRLMESREAAARREGILRRRLRSLETAVRQNHYFTVRPGVASRPREIRARLRRKEWTFRTDRGVFAQERIDPGTRLLIEAVRIHPTDDVLDLGCGYGAIGLVAASRAPRGRAVLVDVNTRAVELAGENARRLGFPNVEVYQSDGIAAVRGRRFDVVVMNPPIRAGRATVRRLVEESREVLRSGGHLWFVARTAQGAQTLGQMVESIFGNVREVVKRTGYRVYETTKEAGVKHVRDTAE